MTKKYIIRNCRVGYDDIKMCGKTLKLDPYTKKATWTNCQDCTDCLLKQIVDKCKEQNKPKSCREYNTDIEYLVACGRYNLANEILSMLEIQECE